MRRLRTIMAIVSLQVLLTVAVHSWAVSTQPIGGTDPVYGWVPVHRFYSPITGAHFYTADEVEAQYVYSQLSWAYSYEGIAWYAPLVDAEYIGNDLITP